ncbi:hypothetical protein [Fluviispira multicolorata]|uniref:Delta-60 repeat domain-containing protein n=1 Tax=Fluviispira multicolorata TaxID=2654512 RepID=A0A833JFS9_9BACT|nr:hypothetical protein [Fluviispira multicolorata]KAB8033573.1 hypothetical protein GCL57_02370 [Fluviispira multicolorata]
MKIKQLKYSLVLSVLSVSLISAHAANSMSALNISNLSPHNNLNPLALSDQSGELDDTFAGNGVVKITLGDRSNKFNKSIVLTDGTIISGGSSVTADNFVSFTLIKFNSDGSANEEFGSNGIVQTKIGISSEIISLSILNDGGILAFGKAEVSPGQIQTVLVGYNANGSLNTSFGNSGILVVDPNIIAATTHTLTKDGVIILGGSSLAKTARGGNTKVFTIAKYDLTGNLVAKFGNKGVIKTNIGVLSFITSISVKKDGLIIAAGVSQEADLNNKFTIAKYFSDGSINKSFGQNGVVQTKIGNNAVINSLTIGSDGTIIVGGQSIQQSMSESSYVITLAKYNVNGTLSNTFGTNGIVFTKVLQNDFLNKHIIQDDGSILAVGTSRDKALNSQFIIVKYNANGTLNTEFAQEGFALGDTFDLNAHFSNITSTSEGSFFISGNSSGDTEAILAKFK